MDSLRSFWDAVQAFWDRLAAVHWLPLVAAVGLHVLNLALRSRAWRAILRAAFPGARVPWRVVFGAYVAGVGVNAIVPARAGDAVKVFLVHRRVEGAAYPTLVSSLLVETLFDLPMALLLVLWAWQAGVVPDVSLPAVPAFEWSWIADHPMAWGTAIIVAAGVAAAALVVMGARVRAFWDRVGQGFAILRTPVRYLREVASWQALGWGCRVGAAYLFLDAFGVPATLENALVVLVVGSVATAMPLTPGGLGPKQALLVVVLGGQAASGAILAFSVGMEATVLVVNVALALVALVVMTGGFGFRHAIREAKSEKARAEGGSGP
ncbi:MAG: flippase-like domain-containing protein [Thermoleophilia bacterium]|jgi:uncharacterized membrane protein YbhN (UPF0104 family)|nr:flippase-like domain-containing protein [Thermoleophilia bacterium]